jgi:hypothetical protein
MEFLELLMPSAVQIPSSFEVVPSATVLLLLLLRTWEEEGE